MWRQSNRLHPSAALIANAITRQSKLFRKPAIILAALLQLLPLVRNVATNPAATSAFAIILRWGVGATAAIGAYDACSGATQPYFVPLQTNIILTVGSYYSNNVIVTNTGGFPGAYFDLFNFTGSDSGQLTNGMTTTASLPTGLTMKVYDTYETLSAHAAIYGTPRTISPTAVVVVDAGYSGYGDIYTNIYFTVTGGGSPPVITNQPISMTNVAGGSAHFAIVAGGAPPIHYQWKFNTNTTIANATNASLTLTNLRSSQSGTYSVVITNSSGSVTSLPALLVVTLPAPPLINLSSLKVAGSTFQFTFNPVPGLTNTVLANSAASGGVWSVLTNVPPPLNTNAVTITDILNPGNRFYRLQVIP